ncbi:YigZ family protein [Mariniphaga sediminis]|uniref:YigZ family protein n=1 Tax=Mariniphaga sediminis TaxID=1628158 RepID=A0A399CWX0_9BACT|nr:YigZ family protein [Mariniphaga sediminis]RIH63478.1 YigZ family protein [Mariniphaga sediminis]
MTDTYKTIKSKSEGSFKDKGSKFFAFVFPVKNEEEVKELLTQIKKEHHSARHHCYAWRLGTEDILFRANDDGEPSSTAGKPILGQLQSFEVTNVFLVVVRYFGGTLLGTSGLINAYRTAAAEALKNADIVTRIIEENFRLKFTYKEMNDVMQIVKQENLHITDTRFELDCQLNFSVRKSEASRIEELFRNFYGVEIEST